MNHHKPYEPKDAAGKLAKGFLRNPLTSVLGVFLLVIGYIALMVMPREENPQMVVSGSTVIVALPGSSAKEVEKIIVKPLERKLKEVKGVEHIYGMAMDNVGIVNVAFYIGEKKEDSNLKVYDKIMQNSDVAVTEIKGGHKHQFNVEVDINKLSGYNLSLGQIMQAVQSLAYNVPAVKNRTKAISRASHPYCFKTPRNKCRNHCR